MCWWILCSSDYGVSFFFHIQILQALFVCQWMRIWFKSPRIWQTQHHQTSGKIWKISSFQNKEKVFFGADSFFLGSGLLLSVQNKATHHRRGGDALLRGGASVHSNNDNNNQKPPKVRKSAGTSCKNLWIPQELVWNIFFVFPEMFAALETQKMSNHTNTWGSQTATVIKQLKGNFFEKDSTMKETAKRWCVPQMPSSTCPCNDGSVTHLCGSSR